MSDTPMMDTTRAYIEAKLMYDLNSDRLDRPKKGGTYFIYRDEWHGKDDFVQVFGTASLKHRGRWSRRMFQNQLSYGPIATKIDQLAANIRQTPEVHCACCYVKAPRVVVKDHPVPGNILGHSQQVNQPNLTGWLIMAYPFIDWYGRGEYTPGVVQPRFGQPWSEVTKVCPRCAVQVIGTVKHMQEGYNDNED